MRWLIGLLVCAALSGCLSDENPPNLDESSDAEPMAAVEDPVHIDESFDLLTTTLDNRWSWSMSEGMTGHVEITLEANPTNLKGADSICYRLEWPQGHRTGGGANCSGVGNLGVSISVISLVVDQTVFSTGLYPNDFDLHVWAPNGPDPAIVRVQVDTFAA